MCLFGVCTDFAPRVGARAACRAREGIGGSITKPTVQTKSAADARSCRLPSADGTRRGASLVPHPRIFAGPKRRATTGCPYTERANISQEKGVFRRINERFVCHRYAQISPRFCRGDQWSPAAKRTFRTYNRPVLMRHREKPPLCKGRWRGALRKTETEGLFRCILIISALGQLCRQPLLRRRALCLDSVCAVDEVRHIIHPSGMTVCIKPRRRQILSDLPSAGSI